MKYLIAFTLLLLCGLSHAQVDTTGYAPTDTATVTRLDTVIQDSLGRIIALTQPVWREASGGARNGYLLSLTDNGNFEEDAGEVPNRDYRYLMGRWRMTDSTASLLLSVDGFLGRSSVHRRYLRGRDFYLNYDIVELTPARLVLRDVLTGDLRTFVAETRGATESAAERRMPGQRTEPRGGGFKIPDGWGGRF